MTQAEKLEALVRRAVDSGWDGSNLVDTEAYYLLQDVGVYDVLFNHDFARALFGGGKVCADCGGSAEDQHGPRIYSKGFEVHVGVGCRDGVYLSEWQYQLRVTVISEDPVDYMYHAIFKDKH